MGKHAPRLRLRYNYLSYADVIRNGIPADYKVLILPACLCLSDIEAKRIRAFVEAGGTMIADFMPGLWDQRGKGRANGGVLDDVFGVQDSPDLKASGVFGGDPDDQQLMIRLMLYSNEFDIEGLIASAAGIPGGLKKAEE